MSASEPPCSIDQTLTSRYECKYLIDLRTSAALRHYLSSHAALDPFSARSDDRRYPVSSLYLDTPSLALFGDTAQGVRNRFKLRLRYYAERGDGPVFFEVKKRSDVIVRKSRERVSRAQAEDFLATGRCNGSPDSGADFFEFLDRCRETGALPALRVRYQREAWESLGADPVRITFDTSVQHSIPSHVGLAESRPDWHETSIGAAVILEVKFTDLRPHWLDEMLRTFQLGKVSVAKYALSVEDIQDAGLGHALDAHLGRMRRVQRLQHRGGAA